MILARKGSIITLFPFQDSLGKETRDKLLLQSKLRQLESDNTLLKDQLEDAEERLKNNEKQVSTLQQQVRILFRFFCGLLYTIFGISLCGKVIECDHVR